MLTSSVAAGGRVGAVIPAAGLERNHGSSAVVGAAVGYFLERFRFELAYDYAGLPGKQSSAYRLDLSEFTLSCGYEVLHRPRWGVELAAGAGYTFAQRTLGTGRETGRPFAGHLGLNLVQREGKSRLCVGLNNCLFWALRPGKGLSMIADLITIRAGVAYVF